VLVALIPVKDLPKAKARLAPVLDEDGRRELTTALYRDVLTAAVECPAVDRVGVVSLDPDALAIATAAGAEAMAVPGDLNDSLNAAAKILVDEGVDRILVLHADLPLVSATAIETIARSTSDVALVSPSDGGTNALACPAGAFAFQYGPGSAQAHREAAWDADLEPELLELPDLALDIDTPGDLERLQSEIESGQPAGTHTINALVSIGLIPEPRRIHHP
jgi:2-phospho-L-lactate guanylyltransferase